MAILELNKIVDRDKVRFRDGKEYELINKEDLLPQNVLYMLSTAEALKAEADPNARLKKIIQLLSILIPDAAIAPKRSIWPWRRQKAPIETLSITDAEQILAFFTERLQVKAQR